MKTSEKPRVDSVLPLIAEYLKSQGTTNFELLGILRGNQIETDRFFGAITGTVPIEEFFDPANIQRIMNSATGNG